MSKQLCQHKLDPRDQGKTYRRMTKQEDKILGPGNWGFEAQPPELSAITVKRPRLRCLTCGGRFLASYTVDFDGGDMHFSLPPHKPNKVGKRKTKKVFDQKKRKERA